MKREFRPVEPSERRAVERPAGVPADDEREADAHELQRLYLARRGLVDPLRSIVASLAFTGNPGRAGE